MMRAGFDPKGGDELEIEGVLYFHCLLEVKVGFPCKEAQWIMGAICKRR
jgi:hypothetical protein